MGLDESTEIGKWHRSSPHHVLLADAVKKTNDPALKAELEILIKDCKSDICPLHWPLRVGVVDGIERLQKAVAGLTRMNDLFQTDVYPYTNWIGSTDDETELGNRLGILILDLRREIRISMSGAEAIKQQAKTQPS